MYRALVEGVEGERVVLPPDETHHLVRVRRSKSGDSFIGLDGHGKVYICRLERDREGWFGRIVEESSEHRESPLQILLGQALIKKDKFEWVIQKATELGVSQIIPLITARTEVQLDEPREEKKMKRWRKIVVEAVKQCGRSYIPVLHQPVPLEALLSEQTSSVVLALDEAKGSSLKDALKSSRPLSNWLLLVGPEGGWDDADREIIRRHNAVQVSLGPRILRTETAAATIISVLQYEFGDLS